MNVFSSPKVFIVKEKWYIGLEIDKDGTNVPSHPQMDVRQTDGQYMYVKTPEELSKLRLQKRDDIL